MISWIRKRSALSSAATERYLNELGLSRCAKQICLSLAPYRACKSLIHSRRSASVSSFLPARLEHRLVEAQIGNQPLQPQICLFHLPHVFEFRRENSTIFLTPRIKRGIEDTQFAADIRHGRTQLSLLQGKGNLLFGELCLFNRHHLRSGDCLSCRNSVSEWNRILYQGQFPDKHSGNDVSFVFKFAVFSN